MFYIATSDGFITDFSFDPTEGQIYICSTSNNVREAFPFTSAEAADKIGKKAVQSCFEKDKQYYAVLSTTTL